MQVLSKKKDLIKFRVTFTYWGLHPARIGIPSNRIEAELNLEKIMLLFSQALSTIQALPTWDAKIRCDSQQILQLLGIQSGALYGLGFALVSFVYTPRHNRYVPRVLDPTVLWWHLNLSSMSLFLALMVAKKHLKPWTECYWCSDVCLRLQTAPSRERSSSH